MKVNKSSLNQAGQGMETFLSAPSQAQKEEIKTEAKQMPKVESSKNVVNDVEEKIKEIERMLANTKELDLTTFSKIVLEKSLRFRLLFVTQKIYVEVVNDQSKTVIVSIAPPRWGGSSLRYLVSVCSTQYCKAMKKQTAKGTIITYVPLGSNNTNNDDIDIFD